ncbi:hypothetical protein [Siccirubricoccus deserti]|uniref:Uncharacterized protein n=1 Tax=Siccirubricoccus deserti TaxID=2013562 RepID=A0A9X0QWG8_9PROT|nr:hypothetical protein [Siccirubricoccus deserti]MBC4013862.1 hypothetical protein [Siccirubricoccus deserti]
MGQRDASGLAWHGAASLAVLLGGLALPLPASADIAPGLACGTSMPSANRAVLQQVADRHSTQARRRHDQRHDEALPSLPDASPAVLRAFFTCPTMAMPRPGDGWRREGPVRLS